MLVDLTFLAKLTGLNFPLRKYLSERLQLNSDVTHLHLHAVLGQWGEPTYHHSNKTIQPLTHFLKGFTLLPCYWPICIYLCFKELLLLSQQE